MALAQQLYEGVTIPGEGAVGLITYMRTDSLSISPVARRDARGYAADRWGDDYVPEKERVYRTRARGAQEAHEAIRPTAAARAPETLRNVLNRDQLRAYTLIWQRFMASQLADARYSTVAIEIDAHEGGELRGGFRANAQRLVFAGHLAALGIDATEESTAADRDAPDTVATLPELADGDALERRSVDGEQHFTEPPPRFTEASLVKLLEEEGHRAAQHLRLHRADRARPPPTSSAKAAHSCPRSSASPSTTSSSSTWTATSPCPSPASSKGSSTRSLPASASTAMS